jgi:hypothetical protein
MRLHSIARSFCGAQGIIYASIGADDLPAMAVEFQLGDRNVGGSKPDRQWRDPADAVAGGAEGGGGPSIAVKGARQRDSLMQVRVLSGMRRTWEA